MSRESVSRSSGALGGAVAGTPIAVVGVYLLNAYILPEPMPLEIGVACGGLINSAAGWVAHLISQRGKP